MTWWCFGYTIHHAYEASTHKFHLNMHTKLMRAVAPENLQWFINELLEPIIKGRYDVIAMSAESVAELRIVETTVGSTGFQLGELKSITAEDGGQVVKSNWLGITADTLARIEGFRAAGDTYSAIQAVRHGLADATKWQLRDKCETDQARHMFDLIVGPQKSMEVMMQLEEALHEQLDALRAGRTEEAAT